MQGLTFCITHSSLTIAKKIKAIPGFKTLCNFFFLFERACLFFRNETSLFSPNSPGPWSHFYFHLLSLFFIYNYLFLIPMLFMSSHVSLV